MIEDGRDGYHAFSRVLHWLVAGMVVLQFVLARMAEAAGEDGSRFREFVLLANHKSVGITVLALVILRLGWRLYQAPPPPVAMPDWQRAAAAISHWGFYVLLIAMPLSGWLMSSASNISVSWFNLFALPDFVQPDEASAERFAGVHETLAKVLFAFALVHVAAAIKHAVIDKDGALRRIVSPVSLALFFVAIIAGIVMLVPDARGQEKSPAAWSIDYGRSYIRFTAEQAGADFDGEWTLWEADLRFDPATPKGASFDVVITVAGVDTKDKDRDETLMDAAFFDGENFPVVRYRAHEFAESADGFVAHGSLEIKGKATPVEFRFAVDSDKDEISLDGNATLDRLVLEVGLGDWSDTAWLGQFVDVNVHIEAKL